MSIRHRIRQRIYDWSRRYSGYENHMNELHPPIGYLLWGDVKFTIKTIVFKGGEMVVTAEAGTQEAGVVTGLVRLLDIDGTEIMSGQRSEYMGAKTAASTWKFTWTVRVPWSMADDTPPAPQPA